MAAATEACTFRKAKACKAAPPPQEQLALLAAVVLQCEAWLTEAPGGGEAAAQVPCPCCRLQCHSNSKYGMGEGEGCVNHLRDPMH